MQTIQRFVKAQFFTIVVLLLAGGFALLLAELLITEHTDGIQLIGVGAAIAGILLIIAALFVRERAATVVAVLLVLLSVTGLIGVFEHLEATTERAQEAQSLGTASVQPADDDGDNDTLLLVKSDIEAEGSEEAKGSEEAEAAPPPLAPLGLAGLSLLGAVAILGAPRQEMPL